MEPETNKYERFLLPTCIEHRTETYSWNFVSYKHGKWETYQRFLCPTVVEHGTETYQWFLCPTEIQHDHEIYQLSVSHKDGSWNSDI